MKASPLFAVRLTGAFACFTRPELKIERVSYEVLTPSAARGILESIFWRPDVRWKIETIEVHQPIRFFELKRTELKSRASRPSVAVLEGRDEYEPYHVDDDRQRRHTVALRDVDYVVRARLEFVERAAAPERLLACVAMFQRRLGRGQHFAMPYLGCREFACDVSWAPERAPLPIDRELGRMLFSIEHDHVARPTFFEARLDAGVLHVPAFGSAS